MTRWFMGCALILALIGIGNTSLATALYWDNTSGNSSADGGSGSWNTSPANQNWWNAVADIAWPNSLNDNAIFGGTAGTVTASGVNAASMQFDTAGYIVNGGTITLGNGAVAANADVTINAQLASAVGLTKSGTGKLTLTAANSGVSGTVTLNAGTLELRDALSVNAQPITLNGGTLLLANDSPTNFASNVTAASNAIIKTDRVSSGTGLTHSLGNVTVNLGAQLQVNVTSGNDYKLSVNDLAVNGSIRMGYKSTMYVNGAFSGTGDLNFYGSSSGLTVENYGLQFRTDTNLPNNIIGSAVSAYDPIVAADGATVNFTGDWISAGGKAQITVKNGGHWIFGAGASVDTILDGNGNFARYLWLHGDSSGIVEFADGFVADPNHGVYSSVIPAFGALGDENGVTIITNNSDNLPVYTRLPNGHRNGHLNLETSGGKWITRTHDQSYDGAIWFMTNYTLQTDTNLTSNGFVAVDSDYTAYNGFQIVNSNVTVTKSGAGNLIIARDQAYRSGDALNITDGGVIFQTDPGDPSYLAYNGGNNGQYLTVRAMGGKATFSSTLARLKNLSISSGGGAYVSAGTTLNLIDTLSMTGGTLCGVGTVSAAVSNSAGTVNPGDVGVKGTLKISGAYTQGASGRLTAEISSAGGDLLQVTGTATLGGTIDSGLLGGFTPTAGASYDVLTAGSISGTFSNTGVNITGGYLQAIYTGTKVSLLALKQGDSNGDRNVNVIDLGLLATNYGASSGATWQMGDYNHDGYVNVIDLGLLATNYGAVYGGVGDVVPEPASAALIAMGVAAFLRRKK